MTNRDWQREIDQIKWFHELELGGGLRTHPSVENLEGLRQVWRFIEDQLDGIDFNGRTVLDVGAWDGKWSFYAERRGAASVLATDDRTQNWAGDQGVRLAREILGSRIDLRSDLPIYELASLNRTFDVILCLGVFYHLRDPLYGLAQLRHCCHEGTVLVLEGELAWNGVTANEVRYFHNHYLEFLPSPSALTSILSSAYFTIDSLRWMHPFPTEPSAQAELQSDRALMVCRPFVGTNPSYVYKPHFGLGAYDPRFREGSRQPPAPTAPTLEPPRLSIVVPAYQEQAGLARGLGAIRDAARDSGVTFELILVDDGSTDDTWAIAAATAAEMPELVAIRLSRNFGKESAIAAGLDEVRGDACIVMDADLQHPPALIPEMVRRWQSGSWDVVEAVKSNRGREAWLHRVTTRAFYRTASWLTGYDLQDASDYKLLDRRVLAEWRRLGERGTFFRGLVAWLGFRRTQLAFEVPPRQAGRSRWSLTALAGLAVHTITSFSALPLQLVTIFGLVMLVVAVVLGAQAIRLWLQGLAFPGFTTVILLQLLIGGLLMISLGVIGTYLARIYDEVKARPRYVVSEARRRPTP